MNHMNCINRIVTQTRKVHIISIVHRKFGIDHTVKVNTILSQQYCTFLPFIEFIWHSKIQCLTEQLINGDLLKHLYTNCYERLQIIFSGGM